MKRVKKFLYTLIFNKYDEFAKVLGYKEWKVAEENTFYVSRLEEDAGWYVTEIPNKKWAVWNDEGHPHILLRYLKRGTKQLGDFGSYLRKRDYQRNTGCLRDLMRMKMYF
ncbi:hypothetical protein MPH47_20850 [Psychrobacillus psychrodurans]|uniref:hypothetical protein n=1 Tax=Psychrobacillus psychrodurans TaxID=126157 RepID=UPI001F4E293F|nr:hypothetical protein [Psychrobacillus psychrodurans]MCK1999640.1 hypothetical protein [Psychrobacillus psychrodurans]